MTYELAKQLKDAGFPQILGHDFITPNGDVMQISGAFPKYAVMLPTLSELIESCGNDFVALVNYRRQESKKDPLHYQARLDEYHNNLPNGDWIAKHFNEPKDVELMGFTPEEAVAKLWLALHSTSPANHS